ncbi:hypothetical protein [Hymenobacter ruber]
MIKSPAFQWYPAEYLADERVTLLSLESEAAYVRLLNYCWREGSIPANPALLSAMCKYADVKVIKPALALFIKSPTQPGRLIHKRLEEERSKQEAFRTKQADNGRNGGRPKKAVGKPNETQTKGLGFSGETQTEPKKSSLSSTSSSSTTDVVPHEEATTATPPEVPAKTPKEVAGLLAADNDQFTAATVPMLNDPRLFAIVIDRLGYTPHDLDIEFYRKQIRTTAESAGMEAGVLQFQNFVKKYINNDKASKTGLIKPAARVVPLEQSDKAIRFEKTPEALAREQAAQSQLHADMIARNLARHARNDGQMPTGQHIGQVN